MSDLSRRGFFGFLAAPAIVRAASLMPIRALSSVIIVDDPLWNGVGYDEPILSGEAIRDLLFPGLQLITGKYCDLPKQWPAAFAANAK